MKKELITVSIYTENFVGLLNRVTTIFTKRHVNIESITASKSEIENVHRYTIVVKESENLIEKIIKQLEKQIDVVGAFYHLEGQTIFQEIALYKIDIENVYESKFKEIISVNHARILEIEKKFVVVEKTGTKEDTDALYNELKPFGLMQFVRSGRVAITKERMNISEILHNN
ncbi:MAG: acetolactate synthase small subunit [Flavobacteriaceae bacterium]|jgi:acetolactate synthase-1/3 small subunit|nr:acetolactate synthase small subunit [Flavobacteriaceae bacterium]MBT3920707.1 acetolactate synthase small subunit [Flavobacteriaceae bacterium]MBT6705596.1 acetolactate synthase small subunit [Flavobacteriaceae bacterium]MBT7241947.1 acetolactate synthase small subunit [Flavobacteriaceae bacterium]|tara:strand:- start:1661 stop:2176 length:516 start_codon:yes stop_codon:yes gene_type:complete